MTCYYIRLISGSVRRSCRSCLSTSYSIFYGCDRDQCEGASFAIRLMLNVDEFFENRDERSVRGSFVDEALFKLFDRGVESS